MLYVSRRHILLISIAASTMTIVHSADSEEGVVYLTTGLSDRTGVKEQRKMVCTVLETVRMHSACLQNPHKFCRLSVS